FISWLRTNFFQVGMAGTGIEEILQDPRWKNTEWQSSSGYGPNKVFAAAAKPSWTSITPTQAGTSWSTRADLLKYGQTKILSVGAGTLATWAVIPLTDEFPVTAGEKFTISADFFAEGSNFTLGLTLCSYDAAGNRVTQ